MSPSRPRKVDSLRVPAVLLLFACSGCSAVVSPDTSRLGGDAGAVVDGSLALDADNVTDGARSDAWIAPGDDAWVAPGRDAWVAPNDAWIAPGDDAWVAPPDAWAQPACVPGVECAGYQDTLRMAPRGAAGATASVALANCVIQLHRSDCCGARHAYGINHAARSTLCSAESACVAMYPPATCTDPTITTDTGQTTANPSEVRIRAVNPMSCSFGTCWTCETFVCTSASCATAPGIAGGCGP